jgi:2-hydroxy-3-oxopropionate reductase
MTLWHQNDLNLALAAARRTGIAAHSGRAWDHSAMVCALELLANHDLAPALPGQQA